VANDEKNDLFTDLALEDHTLTSCHTWTDKTPVQMHEISRRAHTKPTHATTSLQDMGVNPKNELKQLRKERICALHGSNSQVLLALDGCAV
jgi:hypothetical protein